MDIEIYLNKETATLLKQVAELYGMPASRVARIVFTDDQTVAILKEMARVGKEININD